MPATPAPATDAPSDDRHGPAHETSHRRHGWRGRTRPTAPTPTVAEASRLAGSLARWYSETLAGRRDVRPLQDLLTPAVTQRVRCAVLREAARRHAGSATQSAVVSVRSVTVQQHGARFEAVVVVDDGTRATAVACSLVARDTGWLVTEIARPDDRLPALRAPWTTA